MGSSQKAIDYANAKQAGWDDAMYGSQSIGNNPYPENTETWRAWNRGFRAGENAYKDQENDF